MPQQDALLDLLLQQIDEIDRRQALLQTRRYIAGRYARWCDGELTQLENQRTEVEQEIARLIEGTAFYGGGS